MTIQAAIERMDDLKPHMIPRHQVIAWLSELDGMVYDDLMMTHEGMPAGIRFVGYDQETAPDTPLLAPEPYTDIYKHYLAAKIDDTNRETNEYAKDMVLFNEAWQRLCAYWTRTHMPKQAMQEFRL